jgi:hypothetical protein
MLGIAALSPTCGGDWGGVLTEFAVAWLLDGAHESVVCRADRRAHGGLLMLPAMPIRVAAAGLL